MDQQTLRTWALAIFHPRGRPTEHHTCTSRCIATRAVWALGLVAFLIPSCAPAATLIATDTGIRLDLQYGQCPSLVDRRGYEVPTDSTEMRSAFLQINDVEASGNLEQADERWLALLSAVEDRELLVAATLMYGQWSRHKPTNRAIARLETLLTEIAGSADVNYELLIRLELLRLRLNPADIGAIEELVLENRKNLDHQDFVDFMIELGDWYVWAEKSRKARSAYSDAWDAMAASGSDPAEFFESPFFLCACAMLNADAVDDYNKNDPPLDANVVATITKNGTVRSARIEETDVKRYGRHAMSVIRHTHFRPAMRDGKTVSVEDVNFVRRIYEGGESFRGYHRFYEVFSPRATPQSGPSGSR